MAIKKDTDKVIEKKNNMSITDNMNGEVMAEEKLEAGIKFRDFKNMPGKTITEKLKKAGFTKVMNLQGGIFDWVNSGHSVYDNSGSETQKVHAYDKSWGKWLTKGEKVYE
mgnify:CR=1 FL=1